MSKLKVISYSFIDGGAAIAAATFSDLIDQASKWKVDKISQDQAGIFQLFKRIVSWLLVKLQRDPNPAKHSLNLFSYQPVLKAMSNDTKSIFHFHWINNDTLSVWDLDKIPTYSIITLHDEWWYCGVEHYYLDNASELAFQEGYKKFQKEVSGLNWSYLIWKIKQKKLQNRRDLIYTVPSQWMVDRTKSSKLLADSTVFLLPNPIDTEVFYPHSPESCQEFRKSLGLTSEDFIMTFGAIDGSKNLNKGGDLLERSLEIFSQTLTENEKEKICLVSFGGKKGEMTRSDGFKEVNLGHIADKKYLSQLYSSSDCVIVPSRVESFGLVAAEALSCSVPVICFDTSGLRDIVKNAVNGYLAKPFSPNSLSDSIEMFYRKSEIERREMGKNGREYVILNFSKGVIARKYQEILDWVYLKKIES